MIVSPPLTVIETSEEIESGVKLWFELDQWLISHPVLAAPFKLIISPSIYDLEYGKFVIIFPFSVIVPSLIGLVK